MRNSKSITISKSYFYSYPTKLESTQGVTFNECIFPDTDRLVIDSSQSISTFNGSSFQNHSKASLNFLKNSESTFDNCKFLNFGSHCIQANTSKATIINSTFENINFPVCASRSELIVKGSKFHNYQKVCFDLNYSKLKVEKSSFDTCVNGPSFTIANCENVEFYGSTITNSKNCHLEVRGNTKIKISDSNLSSSVKGTAIQFLNNSFLEVINSQISNEKKWDSWKREKFDYSKLNNSTM